MLANNARSQPKWSKTGLKGTNTDKKGKTGLEVHSDNELNLESKKKSNKKK